MEVLRVILLAVALVAVGILGMAIRILLKKGGKFSSEHIGGSKLAKREGIFCATTQDKIAQAEVKKKMKFRNISLAKNTEAGK